ncbi:MAG: hypothetical protein JNG84_13280 [Archangium sp.]|nr:hypothetical protein [Archangium sp.]
MAAALVFCAFACTASVDTVRVRAPAPESIFVRVVQTIERNCVGIDVVDDASGGYVMSIWRQWPLEVGAMRSRCVATITTAPGQAYSEVQVSFVVKYCAPEGSPEAAEYPPDGCQVVSELPEDVAKALTRSGAQIEAELQQR